MIKTTLEPLIEVSKDGEWGKSESFPDAIEMRVIRGTDFEAVRSGEVSGLPIRYVPKQIAERKKLRPSDLLIETAGGSKDRPTGRTLYITKRIWARSDLPLTCASFSRFIRIKLEVEADPLYLFWHLQWLYENRRLLKYHTQHTGVARFQWTTFSTREMLELPDLNTQKKIAFILSAYDDLIENNLRRIKILEEMAQTLYREWFVKFRLPGHQKVKMVNSPLGKIPEGWEVLNVENIVKRHPPGKLYEQRTVYAEGTVPALDQGRSGVIGYHNDSPGVEANEENPVITFANHTCYQRIIHFPFSAIQNVIPFYPNPDHYRNIYWLHYATKDLISFNDYKGHWPEYMGKKVVVPTIQVAEDFGSHIKPNILLVFKLQKKCKNLSQTRDLLLPKLISGELDVSELDITIPEANA